LRHTSSQPRVFIGMRTAGLQQEDRRIHLPAAGKTFVAWSSANKVEA
jgi:hypothetical protein